MTEGCFHTHDMALVAYLATMAISYDDMKLPEANSKVIWYFEKSDALEETLDEYRRGKARVEPKEYQRAITHIREEMYSLIDLGQAA
jgi:Domain of unknown function (DUF5659)